MEAEFGAEHLIIEKKLWEEHIKSVEGILSECYILEGTVPRKVKDLQELLEFNNSRPHHVRLTSLKDVIVSTIFTVYNLGHHGIHDEPVLFETHVFGGDMDGYEERYSTYEEARQGHHNVVDMVEGQIFCLTEVQDKSKGDN
jgi:hypothetical protein